jgi:hypothetical protein
MLSSFRSKVLKEVARRAMDYQRTRLSRRRMNPPPGSGIDMQEDRERQTTPDGKRGGGRQRVLNDL